MSKPTAERRLSLRRRAAALARALPTFAADRGEERRDSPRYGGRLEIREEGQSEFAERVGNFGLEGAFFVSRDLPATSEVEVRFRLPGSDDVVTTSAQIVHRSLPAKGAFGLHLKFFGVDTERQLAIARAIQ